MRIACQKCGRFEPKRCSQKDCPYFVSSKRTFKKDFFGTAPNIFVGRYGYPDVRAGILSTEHQGNSDNPKEWAELNTPIPEIVDNRASLINSQFLANVHSFSDSFLQSAQLIAQAKKPADIEVSLDKAPIHTINYPPGARPHGATVQLKQARLTENVKIPKAVDRAVSDIDLKANTAIASLYGKVDEYALSKLLTGGVLGTKRARKLVPTKWGITAVDDTLGKQLLEKVRDLQVLLEPVAYFGGHYGNYFCILLFPKMWQYELFETLAEKNPAKTHTEKSMWTDYESFSGRSQYAKETAGGYYAARLPILEKLVSLKRQGAVLCVRFVTSEYSNPLGVWVVREAVKKALENKPLRFSQEELLLAYGKARATRFGVEWNAIAKRSILLASFKQKTLGDF